MDKIKKNAVWIVMGIILIIILSNSDKCNNTTEDKKPEKTYAEMQAEANKEKKADSIAKVEEVKEQAIFDKTPAGTIQKSHPTWSRDDCNKLVNGKIWIGMHIQMVVYLRGLPNNKNVSNYGDGNEYQYCWSNYQTSCFYTKEDQIVYSYN
jgi:hypothetical protein